MHPSGNPWVFHFTHRYSMTEGHIGVEILTTTAQGLAESNPERYKDLQVGNGQASEIIAQVGALLKSDRSDNPLRSVRIRKMILAGTGPAGGEGIGFHAHQLVAAALVA